MFIMKSPVGNPEGAQQESPRTMIRFDPHALSQTLKTGAEQIRKGGDATAALVRIEHGNLSVEAGSGLSDLTSGQAAQAHQTYEIGSQTKMMTAVVILQLAEEGSLDLDAPAADYLPSATIAHLPNADTATVRQLLNMTAGIPNYTDAVDADGVSLVAKALLEHPGEVFGPDAALALARDMPATNAPGAAEHYSNTNYLLLGKIIEGLDGKSFIDSLQNRVFDKAGMKDAIGQLDPDGHRLHSYATDPITGKQIDVTEALWETRGESGVAATTADMTGFLKALFIDKTLLGDDALAQMTDFHLSESGPGYASSFGLGMAKIVLDGGHSYVGFTGGTFGTGSSTYLDLQTGAIVSLAATNPDADATSDALALQAFVNGTPGWQPIKDDAGPLSIVSGDAAELRLSSHADGLAFKIGGATLTLDRDLAGLTTQSVRFHDGSVLVVGDNKAGDADDQRANDIDIRRDFAAAAHKDNQILGLGGDDRLRGAAGNDRVLGGDGADLLAGRGGNDQLIGGRGDDRLCGGAGKDALSGGAGRDVMTGGAGADTFIFAATGRQDTIRDFETGLDRIDIAALGHRVLGGELHWVGQAEFSHAAGEGRLQMQGHHSFVEIDLNGDGSVDAAIALAGVTHLSASDLLF